MTKVNTDRVLVPQCASPRLFVADGFVHEATIGRILRLTADLDALRCRGVDVHAGVAGTSCELPLELDPVLRSLAAKVTAWTGLQNRIGGTLRFRRYEAGEYHPPHLDSYVIQGWTLVMTALMVIAAPESGGETVFPNARPEPVRVAPLAGRLIAWFGHRPDGAVDPDSLHEGAPVVRGQRVTLTSFIYQDVAACATTPPALAT